MIPILQTALGKLFQAKCVEFLRGVDADSVDLIFADPPINLGKLYTSKIDDSLKEADYLKWAGILGCWKQLKRAAVF